MASSLFAQGVKWVADANGEHQIPVGPCTWEDLQKSDFFPEMEAFYGQYEPNWDDLYMLVETMRYHFPEYTLRANFFFGAWDYDSEQLLGEFVKYQELLKNEYQYPEFAYNLIAEDQDFKTFDQVPTVDKLPMLFVGLVPKDNEQNVVPLGSIAQVPELTLEHDLLTMLLQARKKMNR